MPGLGKRPFSGNRAIGNILRPKPGPTDKTHCFQYLYLVVCHSVGCPFGGWVLGPCDSNRGQRDVVVGAAVRRTHVLCMFDVPPQTKPTVSDICIRSCVILWNAFSGDGYWAGCSGRGCGAPDACRVRVGRAAIDEVHRFRYLCLLMCHSAGCPFGGWVSGPRDPNRGQRGAVDGVAVRQTHVACVLGMPPQTKPTVSGICI